MRTKYLAAIFICFLVLSGCSKDDDPTYQPIIVEPETPIVDLTQVPYQKLSEYKFFTGPLKNQSPVADVLPFEPISGLFTDYASKKRFVWMPKNTKGTFAGDGNIIELPVGAALIKNFYYENVQGFASADGVRIIETRIMIRKTDGWIFAEYVWNDEQTEAFLDMNGSFTPIEWKDANNITHATNYRIPSEAQCTVCHKHTESTSGGNISINIPIGIKPQSLNYNFNYGTTSKNQLTAWIEAGFLESGFSLPSTDNTAVYYGDTSKSVELRARSYVDINCAHCHSEGKHCDYRPLRLSLPETKNNRTNMGVCVETADMQDFAPALSQLVTPGNINRSMLYHRLNTTDEAYRMPLHGRSVIHEEGIQLIEQWINSLESCD